MADRGRSSPETDAAARAEGAFARSGSFGGVERDGRRLHRGTFLPDKFARGRALRARAPARAALRARANLEARNLTKAEATLRGQNDPRDQIPSWLTRVPIFPGYVGRHDSYRAVKNL